MCESRAPFIEFCCMGHETYFTEDFYSDEEDFPSDFDFKSNYSIGFMPEAYEDIQKEIIHTRFHEEVGIQCEFVPDLPLSQLSHMQAISTNVKDKLISPNSGPYILTHTAKVFFPVKRPESVVCEFCNLIFKNKQSLKTHEKKKHLLKH